MHMFDLLYLRSMYNARFTLSHAHGKFVLLPVARPFFGKLHRLFEYLSAAINYEVRRGSKA